MALTENMKHMGRRTGVLIGNLVLAPFIVLAIVSGCAQFDSNVGQSVVGEDLQGVIKEAIVPAERTANVVEGDVFKSNQRYMNLGSQSGFSCDLVVRFRDFGAIGDTVLAWHKAEVVLVAAGFVDSASVTDWSEWNADIFRIEELFETLDLSYDDELEMTSLGEVALGTPHLQDTLTFALDAETMTRWTSSDTLCFGLRIIPSAEASFLKHFYTKVPADFGLRPTLRLEVDQIIGIDTSWSQEISVQADFTTFLANDEFETDSTAYLFLGGGYARRALLYGDFSRFNPAKVSLGRVDLVIFPEQSGESNFGSLGNIRPYHLANDWFDDPQSAEFQSYTNQLFSIGNDDELARLNLTVLARLWVTEPDSNRGVGLRVNDEGADVSRRAFHDVSADSLHRPFFHVIYTEYESP